MKNLSINGRRPWLTTTRKQHWLDNGKVIHIAACRPRENKPDVEQW
jgi:hypothetical protein